MGDVVKKQFRKRDKRLKELGWECHKKIHEIVKKKRVGLKHAMKLVKKLF